MKSRIPEQKPVEEKKILTKYSITRYENGELSVDNIETEGATELSSEQIYKDIEDVAELIKLKRIENSARVGAYEGVFRFFQAQEEARLKAAETKKED